MPANAIRATAGAGDDLLVGYRWLDGEDIHLQHRPTRGEQPQDDIRRAFCTRIPVTAWDQVCTRLADWAYWGDPLLDRSVHLIAGYDHWTFKRKIVPHHDATLDQVWVRTAPLGPERGHIIVLRYDDWAAFVVALARPAPLLRLEDLDGVMTAVLLRRERGLRGRS